MARAFVLAGGLGTRLAPYTTILPKPLMPLGQHSILERLIIGLVASELTDITISLGYLGHLVEAVVADGSRFGAAVTYTRETEPLGTAGALKLLGTIADDEVIVVVNGDTLTDLDFRHPVSELVDRGAEALVVCVPRQVTIDFGVVHPDEGGWLASYEEKPTLGYLVSTGINVLRGSALRDLPPGRLDMPDLLRSLMDQNRRVACLPVDSQWWDLGRPEDLLAVNDAESGFA